MPRKLIIQIAAALSLGSALAAQSRTITVQNLAPSPREEWVVATVPFARGAVEGVPDLHVDGHPTVWQPFGARWPDGTTRHARCLFRTKLRTEVRNRRVVTGKHAVLSTNGMCTTVTHIGDIDGSPVVCMNNINDRTFETEAHRLPVAVKLLVINARGHNVFHCFTRYRFRYQGAHQ